MLNLLIANKNEENLQNLLNYISQYIPEIRVSYLTTNGADLLDAITKYHFDIILMDQHLKEFNGYEVLEQFTTVKPDELKKSIIFLSSNKTLRDELKTNKLIYKCIADTKSIAKIIDALKKLIDEKKQSTNESYVKTKIITELQNVGYNLAHHGTHYLSETIFLIFYQKYDSENLTKYVYPKVSKIYNKPLNNIKTNIITATDAACKNMDKNILKNHLKIPDYIKPTAKMVINSVLKKLNY